MSQLRKISSKPGDEIQSSKSQFDVYLRFVSESFQVEPPAGEFNSDNSGSCVCTARLQTRLQTCLQTFIKKI